MVSKAVVSSPSYIAVYHSSEQSRYCNMFKKLEGREHWHKTWILHQGLKTCTLLKYCNFLNSSKSWKDLHHIIPLFISAQKHLNVSQLFSQIYHDKIQIIGELITRQTLPHRFTLQEQVWKHIQCVRHQWSQHTAYSQLTPATHYSPVPFAFHRVQYQTVSTKTSRN